MSRSKEWYDKRFYEEYRTAMTRINQLEKQGIFVQNEYKQDLKDLLKSSDYKNRFQEAKWFGKTENLQQNSYMIDTETGEAVSVKRIQFENKGTVNDIMSFNRDERMENAVRYADIVIQNFEFELSLYDSMISNRSAANGMSTVMNWWNEAKSTHSKEELAYAIQSAGTRGLHVGYQLLYDESYATAFINALTEFLGESEDVKVVVQALQTEVNDNIPLEEDEDGNIIT